MKKIKRIFFVIILVMYIEIAFLTTFSQGASGFATCIGTIYEGLDTTKQINEAADEYDKCRI